MSACTDRLVEKLNALNAKLQTSVFRAHRLNVTANGSYTAPANTGYTVVDVNVAGSVTPTGTLTITENGTYPATQNGVPYAEIVVNVP